ncbi:MAG: hypothetical protein A2521_09040 [Deltaproteobacteria bacterium RIFOXYD12_FULL_57_12]|nr:MAG: hypothetical protein A2521_09040 [Deltaproteobacteria bacterium RIFOXYD12_FULL_57_12]
MASTEFQVYAPGAAEIFLAGDFNNWESGSPQYRLRKYAGDVWKKKVQLSAGRYEYQFVVDGSWQADPQNSERACNPFGSENSVITVL